MSTIFEGIRVLDLGRGFAPMLATMILADNGAEVIKVEPPGGDPARTLPAWIMWNRGKRSLTADLDAEADRATLGRLAGQVDVLIEDYLPGELDRRGLGYETLAAANPGLLYCSVVAFGSRGAYRHLPAYDGVVQAKAGSYLALANWMQREEPTYRVRPDAGYATANLIVQAVSAGLRVRTRIGRGQRVETSLYRGVTCYEAGSFEADQKRLGLIPNEGRSPTGPRAGHLFLNYLVARSKDGQWLQLTNNTARLFPMFIEAIGLGDLYQDPRFKGMPFAFPDEANRGELRRRILAKMVEKTADAWLALFIEKGLAGDLFLTTQQFMDHPQTYENQGVVTVRDPLKGETKQIGPLVRFARTASRIGRPAPLPGADTEAILAEAEARAAAPGTRRPGGTRPDPQAGAPLPAGEGIGAVAPAPTHPFAGLLVLDFAGWLAAPFGTSLVADLGARVIKVESLAGDEYRGRGQARGRTFQGKESFCVDLKNADGRALMRRLLARADALMHNMRGDAADRLGIDYATVRGLNPEIVYLYAGSYGSTGPGAGRAAFHPTAGALAGGALWQLGRGNEPPPADEPLTIAEIDDWSLRLFRANEGSPDVSAALGVGTALAMALYHKARTGDGQYLETSMLISNAYVASEDFLRYADKPPRREADRYLRGLHALCRLYRTAIGWLFLDCQSEREWQALCRALGRADLLDDSRFRDAESRLVHDGALVAALAQAFATRSATDWEATLPAAGVPAVAADTCSGGEFFLTDPSLAAEQLAVRTEHPTLGVFYRPGPPALFSLTPACAEPANALGEDTAAILRELGLDGGEIARLEREGVIRTAG
jgi:crotonobetainyl-CoA:carnitine CoA-transferase CaiB-like acyl-CoA transferase